MSYSFRKVVFRPKRAFDGLAFDRRIKGTYYAPTRLFWGIGIYTWLIQTKSYDQLIWMENANASIFLSVLMVVLDLMSFAAILKMDAGGFA